MFETVASLFIATTLVLSPLSSGEMLALSEAEGLAEKSLSLDNRYSDPWVNEVFADNIVLNLRYLDNAAFERPANKTDFNRVRQPFKTSFTLQPGQTFAFQDATLPELKDKVVKTTNGRFNHEQGFRNSGYLMGDGVCHLASFINQAAREAGLEVKAPVNHNFAVIPDIPAEFGTSIFYMPGSASANSRQNLYVTNNLNSEVLFAFKVEEDEVILTISKK